jgi:hypothetical protein
LRRRSIIIIDEKAYAINLISHGSSTPYPKLKDVEILAKYWKYEGLETHEIHQKLNEYCIKTDPLFNMASSGWKIKKALNTIKLYRLRTTFPVVITKAEVATIQQFKDYNYQKVLFVLIVLAKYLKYSNTRIKPTTKTRLINDFYVNEKILNIVKISRISIRKEKRNQMLRAFFLAGVLDATTYNTLKIKCIDENSEPEIVVTDFENLVLYWCRFCGEKIAGCSNCGKLFLQRTAMQSKCRSCYSIDKKEKTRLAAMKNYYNKKDNSNHL